MSLIGNFDGGTSSTYWTKSETKAAASEKVADRSSVTGEETGNAKMASIE